MSEIPAELRFLASHEWARVNEDGTVTVGISDHAQDSLGDIVFVEVPEIGAELTAHSESAVVESVKAASDIYAPVSGEVIGVNEALEDEPELVNSGPYTDGWLYTVQPEDISELDDSLDAEAYAAELEDE